MDGSGWSLIVSRLKLTVVLRCFYIGQQYTRRLYELEVNLPIVHLQHLSKEPEAVLLDHRLNECFAEPFWINCVFRDVANYLDNEVLVAGIQTAFAGALEFTEVLYAL